jgi:hypothetical protein
VNHLYLQLLADDRLLATICLSEQMKAVTSVMHEECGDGWSGAGSVLPPASNSLPSTQQSDLSQRDASGQSAVSTWAVGQVSKYAMIQASQIIILMYILIESMVLKYRLLLGSMLCN